MYTANVSHNFFVDIKLILLNSVDMNYDIIYLENKTRDGGSVPKMSDLTPSP